MDFLPVIRNESTLARYAWGQDSQDQRTKMEADILSSSRRLGSKLQTAPSPYPHTSTSSASTTRTGRLFRTASLSSIVGSPAQPASAAPSTHLKPLTVDIQAASSRMARFGSADSRYHPRSAALPATMSPSTASFPLLFPPPAGEGLASPLEFGFSSSSKGKESSATPLRPRANRLGSAFHGAGGYPSPPVSVISSSTSNESLASNASSSSTSTADAKDSFFLGVSGSALEGSAMDDETMVEDDMRAPCPATGGAARLSPDSEAQSARKRPLFASTLSYADTPAAVPFAPYSSSSATGLGLGVYGSRDERMARSTSPMSATFDLNDLSLENLDTEPATLSTSGSGGFIAGDGWNWGRNQS